MIDPVNPALRAFLARDLAALASLGGLPPGLPLGDVAAVLGADPGAYGRWFLGDPARETFWCPATGVDAFDDTVKIWFRDGTVVKLEGEWPELDPDSAAALGPPELQLDHHMDVLLVKDGEQVWPGKGIALKLNRSGTRVVGLSTFPPTTADGYREALKDVDEYRESPASGGSPAS
jgi:hypothetical protein